MEEKDLTKYGELKQQIIDCVKFCAYQKISTTEFHQLPRNRKARKKFAKEVLSYIDGSVSEFKAESKRLFSEEYSIDGLYSAAVREAYKQWYKEQRKK